MKKRHDPNLPKVLYLLPNVGLSSAPLLGLTARAAPFFRRIVKDYEYTLLSSVNWLYLANIQLMLQRI
ncbi:hypothetical protein WBJ53_30595 [Spirosoma sp. SC4-14]|uniref:hypothetical protein n=1 Tax=Spirosoma sp. SC4-14 TaxID=3128900 RepID=UPI0030CA9EEA